MMTCDMLYECLLPVDESLGSPPGAILMEENRDSCDCRQQHPYEWLILVGVIEVGSTRAQSSGLSLTSDSE